MKIDLQRTYDCVDWRLLRLILIKIGWEYGNVEWIMASACVTNIFLSIPINGTPQILSELTEDCGTGVHYPPYSFYWSCTVSTEISMLHGVWTNFRVCGWLQR